MINRRNFIKSSALLSLASMAGAHNLFAMTPEIQRLGIQLFSLPKMLDQDFEGTLEMLSAIGYKEIELFGPYTFSAEAAKKSWAGAATMLGFSGSGYFGKSQSEINALMKKHGFTVPAMHTDLDTLTTKMPELAAAANSLGAKYVVLPSIPDDKRKTAEDYKNVADRFNKIGEEAKKHGIRFAYHNHGYGFHEENGIKPIDIIFKETDPNLVFYEMDLFWTVAAGAEPVRLLEQHKDRYKLMHVKDMKEKRQFSGDGGDASQWFALFPLMTSAGEGVLDLPKIIATAKRNGVDHFFVEQDLVAEPKVALKESYQYLKSM
jgi:sugar phosphate isomerase/epimerase